MSSKRPKQARGKDAKLTDSSKGKRGDSISTVEGTSDKSHPLNVSKTLDTKKPSDSSKKNQLSKAVSEPNKSTRASKSKQVQVITSLKGKDTEVNVVDFESETPPLGKLEEGVMDPNLLHLPTPGKQTSGDVSCKALDSESLVEGLKNGGEIGPDEKSMGSSEESCLEISQPVATDERQTSVGIPGKVHGSTCSVEELKSDMGIVPGEKSTGPQEGSCVDTPQPVVIDEKQSKNSESTSVGEECLESAGVNENSVNFDSLALDNEAVYEKKIRSIDSELDSVFRKISEINLKIELRDEDEAENQSLAILRELREVLESFEEENDGSKNLELNRNVEMCNPKAMTNKESRILELRTLLQLRTRKSIGLMVLQTRKSHWIDLLDELFRRRSSTVADLNRLKSGSECLNVPQKDKQTRVALSGMDQDGVLPTPMKIFWEKQPVLTKERLAASLGPLIFSNPRNSKVEFAKKKIIGNIQGVDQRTMSELKGNVDRAIRVVSVLSDDVNLKKLSQFKALILEGSLGSLIGAEVGEIDGGCREVSRQSSGALAVDNMSVVSSELSTRFDEIRETHSESCDVLRDLWEAASAKTVVHERVGWIDSVIRALFPFYAPREGPQYEKEKQMAYSELVDFFMEMDQLDSKITPLDEQALEYEGEKALLSRKLTGCIFEHPSSKVETGSDAESFVLDARVGTSHTELLRIHMQQLKRMSVIRECREYLSESQLQLWQRRNMLVKEKSKLRGRFEQELKSKFNPATVLCALQTQKAEVMAQSDSLSKRESKLMARLKALSERNAGMIKKVNVKQLP